MNEFFNLNRTRLLIEKDELEQANELFRTLSREGAIEDSCEKLYEEALEKQKAKSQLLACHPPMSLTKQPSA